MFSCTLLVCYTIAALVHQVISASHKLPVSTKLCKRHDPKLGDCLRDGIQSIIPDLAKGIPSLGVMPMDPLKINLIDIDQLRSTGSIKARIQLKNSEITGINSIKTNAVNADWDKGEIGFLGELSSPLILRGGYNISGKLMVLPITGAGKANFTLDNLKGEVKLKGKEEERKGEKYYVIEKFTFTFDTDRLTLYFGNLFNGDPVLGENMNKFMNENWREILNELKPSFEETFSVVFKDFASKIFSKIPIRKIAL